MIVKHKCEGNKNAIKFQSKKYGQGFVVANKTMSVAFRCTICGNLVG